MLRIPVPANPDDIRKYERVAALVLDRLANTSAPALVVTETRSRTHPLTVSGTCQADDGVRLEVAINLERRRVSIDAFLAGEQGIDLNANGYTPPGSSTSRWVEQERISDLQIRLTALVLVEHLRQENHIN